MDVDINHQLLLVWSVNTIKASTHIHTHYTVHVHNTQVDVFHTYICTVYTHTHTLTVNQHVEEQR